jgi:GNAT superfamily N-acetyltransferase
MSATGFALPRPHGGSTITIRRIQADDGPSLQSFVRRLSARSRYLRFFSAISGLSRGQLERFLNLEPARGLALVAQGDSAVIIAEARCVLESGTGSAEFAIAVADEFQRQGLGTQLMAKLVDYASGAGVRRLFGEIKADNAGMLALVRRLGFQIRTSMSDGSILVASMAPQRLTPAPSERSRVSFPASARRFPATLLERSLDQPDANCNSNHAGGKAAQHHCDGEHGPDRGRHFGPR